MRLFTLAQLRDKVRQRADMEDDGNFIPDDELNAYINESVSELYDIILETEQSTVFVKNSPILTQVGTYAYELPSDFYKLTSAHYLVGGDYFPAYPADARAYAELTTNPPHEREPRYYVRAEPGTGQKYIYVFPEVNEAVFAITYIPYAPYLELDADKFDGFNGWEEYVIVDSAVKCLSKEESDTSVLELRRQQLVERIRSQAGYMDTGYPKTIRRLPRRQSIYRYDDGDE